MPSYPNPTARPRPTLASVLRSWALDQGLPSAELLPAAVINRIAAEEGVCFGEPAQAVYNPAVTLWAFLAQCLSPSKSCVAAVARVIVLFVTLSRAPCAASTGAYCKARAKLPVAFLRRLTYQVGQAVEEQAPATWQWKNRTVKLVDGTTLLLPDTPANQRRYPQPGSQQPGLGFPMIRLVVFLTFATAVLVGAAYGPYQGKETGETALFRQLLDQIQVRDVVVADRYYGSYWMVALVRGRGADIAVRLHQLRSCDFRRGRRLGERDHVVVWPKPARPAWMDVETYGQIPDELVVREVGVTIATPGYRARQLVVVTTLTDNDTYSRNDIADLYHRRWHVELDIRSIKQTLGMEMLTCKTPEMVEKELWAHWLGYNLVRQVMGRAAREHGLQPRQLSFAGAVQTLNSFRWLLLGGGEDLDYGRVCRSLSSALARHQVGKRPNRCEPRRVKRRRDKYKHLREPRASMRAKLLQGTIAE